MDLVDVEHIGFDAFGGADSVVVTDLTGTDAESVDVDLAAVGGAGDGQPDSVIARGGGRRRRVRGELVTGRRAACPRWPWTSTSRGGEPATTGVIAEGGAGSDTVRYSGTDGDDAIPVFANGTAAAVAPLGVARIDAAAVESLVLLGLDGEDTITAVGNLARAHQLTMDGGDGDDTLRGGNGADLLLGGTTAKTSSTATRAWTRRRWAAATTPSSGIPATATTSSRAREAPTGSTSTGAGVGENLEVSANGPRVRVTRNIANIVMDLDDVERLAFHVFAGMDNVVVNDLAGTDAARSTPTSAGSAAAATARPTASRRAARTVRTTSACPHPARSRSSPASSRR